MLNNHILETFTESFEFKPLKGQKKLMKKLSNFVSGNSKGSEIFLLKGYAGTGKTSIIAALIKSFKKLKLKSVLMAPTGRAAKVLSHYSDKEAFTIHKKIYRQRGSNDDFGKFELNTNLHSNTFFIVDEASMIANQSFENSVFGSGRLLDDLIEFVYNKKNCKLILVGDTAQLPPVKLNLSPALEKKELETFGFEVIEHELTEVIRQKKKSGILHNATNLRNIISENNFSGNSKINYPNIKIEGFTDIRRIRGSEIIESISDAYAEYSEKDVIVICRSNKRANRFNMGIRNMVMFREEEISAGDLLMIVKNNYFWAEEYEKLDFIANGDTAEIVRINSYTERYGLRFADVTLRFADYNDLEIETKIILDTLQSETPSLSSQQNKDFYFEVEKDYSNIRSRKNRFKKIRKNPFFNALQVKYAYAITGHKAQGGQWKKVYLDQGWLIDDMMNVEYLRWLYTALTRSTTELELINFNKDFFSENDRFETELM